jgi:hypothetical protein
MSVLTDLRNLVLLPLLGELLEARRLGLPLLRDDGHLLQVVVESRRRLRRL